MPLDHAGLINAFLTDHGLATYIETFAAVGFDDFDVFSTVTDPELKEMGLPLGARISIFHVSACALLWYV